MINVLRRVFACTRAAAAIEAALVVPLFLMLTVGMTDLGSAMYEKMAVNAAAQAGARYAVLNSGVVNPANNTCSTPVTSTCLSNIQTAMDDASGGLSINASPAPTIRVCADGSPECIVVTASYRFTPILPDAAYSWAPTFLNLSSQVTIRIL